MHNRLTAIAMMATTLAATSILAGDRPASRAVAHTIAALDSEYQAAVERNDWQVMDRILHPDFMLVLGNGTVVSRAELISSARDAHIVYEKQVEEPGTQSVRLYGEHTATVTALLLLEGTRMTDNSQFQYKLWFTDTYVLTKDGWKYALGQASTRL